MNILWYLLLKNDTSYIILLGTTGMLVLATGLILLIIFHQRKMIQNQLAIRKFEENQQRTLLNASIASQEQERQRIAADLHDDAGPLLAAARLHLNENLFLLTPNHQRESIGQVKDIIDETIDLIRNISHRLVPPTLKNFGLASAASDIFQKLNTSGAIKACCTFKNNEKRFVPEKEASIFRVIQELLNNILKHSKASFIHLEEISNEENLKLLLRHDGQGLTTETFLQLAASANGLGLKNIQSRIKLLSGKINFTQNPDTQFFEIEINIPA